MFVAALSFLGPFKRRVVLTPEALEEHEAAGRLSSAPHPKVSVQALQPRRRGPSQEKEEKNSFSPASSHTTTDNHRIVAAVTVIPVRAGSPPTSPLAAASVNTATDINDAFSSFSSGSSPRRRTSLPVSERLSFSAKAAETYRQRTAIPFIPVVLTFKNVEYSVPLPPGTEATPDEVLQSGPHAGQLRLLRNIDGVFRPFVLTALMGATGKYFLNFFFLAAPAPPASLPKKLCYHFQFNQSIPLNTSES